MAAIKFVYVGGGATRGPGTLASIVRHAAEFSGSEIVLVDIDEEMMELTRQVGQRFIEAEGADLRLSMTMNRQEALVDADAVLTSYRPGGFAARRFDESIPLKHGVIGQETQGPGGFFMALRAITAMKEIVQDMEEICPNAWLINYTNPINLVSEAVTHHSPIQMISLCEGPFDFADEIATACGLDPSLLDTNMIGLNHACWSMQHLYDGQDIIPLIKDAHDRVMADPEIPTHSKRMVKLACFMDRLPAQYFQYYYYREEVLAELRAAPLSRSEVILSEVPSYRAHYREQAVAERPVLDPALSRGGIMELELAIDVLAAIVNDSNLVYPCNVPNRGAIQNFADDRIVEVPCLVNKEGATPLAQGSLPADIAGLVEQLGHYQALAGEAAWCGNRKDAIRALTSNPLVIDLDKATIIYDEMAAAHRAFLPERLLH